MNNANTESNSAPDAEKAIRPNELRRTWLFGPGADARAHEAMGTSRTDALIICLEDGTPPERRAQARGLLSGLIGAWRQAGYVTAVRVNQLDRDGTADLAAALNARAHVIAYPMATCAQQMKDLDQAITDFEQQHGLPLRTTEILPVCETAQGVANVRAIVSGSSRIGAGLLGVEDLVNDLCAERHPDGEEMAHARRRFLLDCRAARIEPIDAPYTFSDVEGAVREAREARRLGYRSKSLVRPEHASAVTAALTPDKEEIRLTPGALRAQHAVDVPIAKAPARIAQSRMDGRYTQSWTAPSISAGETLAGEAEIVATCSRWQQVSSQRQVRQSSAAPHGSTVFP